MESLHIMWIIIVALICVCIIFCNWLSYKSDKPKKNINHIKDDTYDPDAMP